MYICFLIDSYIVLGNCLASDVDYLYYGTDMNVYREPLGKWDNFENSFMSFFIIYSGITLHKILTSFTGAIDYY